MFSRTADYAIRAVLLLARNTNAAPLSADELATALGAPRNYLGKTLNTLVRQGVLNSTRGPRGGFTLVKDADRLSIADIVDLFSEPKVTVNHCIMGNRPCNPANPCVAHERWTDVTERARTPLMRTTIAELCGTARTDVPNAQVADHTSAVVVDAGRNPIPTGTSHELLRIS